MGMWKSRAAYVLSAAAVLGALGGGAPAAASRSSGTAVVPITFDGGLDTIAFGSPARGCAGGLDLVICTQDGGRHWYKRLAPTGIVTQLQFVDANDAWAVTGGRLWQTRDGGTQWLEDRTPYSVSALDFATPLAAWAVTGHAGLIETIDGGSHFKRLHPPTGVLAASLLNASQGWIYGSNGETLYSADGGQHWQGRARIRLGTFWRSNVAQLTFLNVRVGWLLLSQGSGCGFHIAYVLYATQDGGRHWTPRLTGGSVCEGAEFPRGVTNASGYPGNFSSVGSQRGFFGVADPVSERFAVVESSDGERHWVQRPPAAEAVTAETVAITFLSAKVGWAVTGAETDPKVTGRILHTSDGGRTWKVQFLVP